MLNRIKGNKYWLVKTPFYAEEFEEDIKPILYELIDFEGEGFNVFKNVEDNSIFYYGIMDERKWKEFQITLL
jgi:hypothetical protein